jgi:hypothetical protein
MVPFISLLDFYDEALFIDQWVSNQ